MAMQPVAKSSFIHSVGHDEATGTLIVLFHKGDLWTYDGVSAELHAQMMAAESVGKFFIAKIKDAFQATKISVPA